MSIPDNFMWESPPQHPGSKMFQAPQFSSLCKYKQIIGVAFDKT